jgi:signal transduction histidine kinase
VTLKPLAVLVGLLALLTYLLVQSRTRDQAPRLRMQEVLQQMHLHDAELNRDVLMARAGLLPNYDPLVRAGRKLTGDLQAMRTWSAAITGDSGGVIHRHVVDLHAEVDRKLELVEYLKSDNALLRNSLAYFAQLIPPLAPHAGTRGSAEVFSLAQLVLRFVQAPEPANKAQAETALARITRMPLDAQTSRPLAVHGRLIVDMLPRVDTLLNGILSSATTRHAEALHQALLQYASLAETRAQRFRFLLYLAALVLLAYLLRQFARLRANARDLRRKEIQLIQANKMTSLGTLVSAVAHEVNNPNQVVLMNSGLLASAWADAAPVLDRCREDGGDFPLAGLNYGEMRETLPQVIRQIQEGARQIERIIGDLKDYARPRARAMELFSLNDVVQRALRLLAHVIQKRTDRLEVHLGKGLPPARGHPQQVEQIVVNLVINALEALPDRKRAVAVSTSLNAASGSLVLEVWDEGVGIPKHHLPHLGEPFFTTKEANGGTGLGLAITSSLVRSHSGRLRFVSEPGEGTRAIVELPVADSEPGASE